MRVVAAATLAASGLLGGTSAPARAWGATSATAADAASARPEGVRRADASMARIAQRTCRDADVRPTRANLARVAAATLCLIERERRAYRLGRLRSNGSLRRIAASLSREMVAGDYFGDNSLTGWSPLRRIAASRYASGARSVSAAQNIGWGSAGLSTPAAMVRGWMLSPPHREIMLTGGYRDVGVGVAPAAPQRLTGGLPGATYTVEFAARG